MAVLATFAGPARATVFSAGGWGWWLDQGDPAALGRGGTSVAVSEYGASGAVNPAAIAGAELTYGFGAYQGEFWKVEGGGEEYGQRKDLLSQIGGVIRLPGRFSTLRAGVLFRPQSDASYDRFRALGADSGAFTLRTKGAGGWNRIQVLLAGRSLGGRVDWGATIGRAIGTVKVESIYDFASGTQGLLRSQVEGRMTGAWTGGAGAIARPHPRLALGASFGIGGTSRMIQESRVIEGGSFSETWHGRQELPADWAVGAQVKPFRRTALCADYQKTLWGDAGLQIERGGPFTHPFDDATRWGIGIEQTAGGAQPRAVWRAGYAHTTSYVSAADGTSVTERALTLGARAFGGKGRSALDLTVELGKRGDEKKLGVGERFARITFGVTYSSALREY
jgi:hypothetical protein